MLFRSESDVEAYGLDASDTDVEKVPLVITPVSNLQLERFNLGGVNAGLTHQRNEAASASFKVTLAPARWSG